MYAASWPMRLARREGERLAASRSSAAWRSSVICPGKGGSERLSAGRSAGAEPPLFGNGGRMIDEVMHVEQIMDTIGMNIERMIDAIDMSY